MRLWFRLRPETLPCVRSVLWNSCDHACPAQPCLNQKHECRERNRHLAKNSNFYPVLLAGGRGTRFWPLSRMKRAKRLLALDGKQSMIQQTVACLLRMASPKQFWIITNDD